MLKAALVGCGSIAEVHAQIMTEAQKDGIIDFISCCDVKRELAEKIAAKHGCKLFNNLKDLIAAEKPDIIHITTPHYAHVPMTLYAVQHGVHVFLEKPAASSMSDVRVLLDAANLSDKQIGICFQNRYNDAPKYVKKILDSGESGKIICARALVNWARFDSYYTGSDWRGSLNTEGSSVLINQSIHTIDLLQWLLGGEPIHVEGSVANRGHKGIINTEDTAEALLVFENGINVLFYASVNYGINASTYIEIECENIKFEIIDNYLRIIRKDGTIEEPRLKTGENIGKEYWGSGHKKIIYDFYSHLIKGEAFPLNAAEGCRALNTTFRIIEHI